MRQSDGATYVSLFDVSHRQRQADRNMSISQETFNKSLLDQVNGMSNLMENITTSIQQLNNRIIRVEGAVQDGQSDNSYDELLGDNRRNRHSQARGQPDRAPFPPSHHNPSDNQRGNQPPPEPSAVTRCYSNLHTYLDLGALSPSSRSTELLQEEFATIKDSVANIRLPPGLKVSDSRAGLKRDCQTAFNSAQRCARYSEVTLKILSTLPENDGVVRDLITIQAAQLKYLTDECCAMLVSGNFNDQTSKIFRTLQHNTAFADSENLSTLRSAALPSVQ